MTLENLRQRRAEALEEARRHHEAWLKADGALIVLDMLIADEASAEQTVTAKQEE